MISFYEADLKKLIIHRVGNKSMDEPLGYSAELSYPVHPNRDPVRIGAVLMQFMLRPFEKSVQQYQFHHPSGELSLNEVCNAVDSILSEELDHFGLFESASQDIAKHLYDVSTHPKIKGGSLLIALFDNVQLEGELHPAIGIFKIDELETFLKLTPFAGEIIASYEEDGININNLSKGCLIIPDIKANYKVLCIDKSTARDAVYWKDEFLSLDILNNDFNKTNTVMSVFKNFVGDRIDQDFEISKADKIDLLNKSLQYFKEKEGFDLEEFCNDVISNEAATEAFKAFKNSYAEEFDTEIPDSFDISDSAVKKQVKSYRGTLKLDKNFQINISGSKELIEKGFDDEKAMNYYKVYFREEA